MSKTVFLTDDADVLITGSLSVVERKWCAHRQVTVDEEARTVECVTCGRPLDAFAVLLEYAKLERNMVARRKHLSAQIQRLHDSVEDLKREERNVRARLKRLKGKQP